MRIEWQKESGSGSGKNAYGRRESRKNIIRMLDGTEWDRTRCVFKNGGVYHYDDSEIKVLSGPNNRLPYGLSNDLLIVDILDDNSISDEDEISILHEIAATKVLNGSTTEERINDLIGMLNSRINGVKPHKIINLIYIPKNIVDLINNSRDTQVNTSTVINSIYECKYNDPSDLQNTDVNQTVPIVKDYISNIYTLIE